MDNERFLEPRTQHLLRDYDGRDVGSMADLQQAGLVVTTSPHQGLKDIPGYQGSESRQEPIYKHLG
ncbi:MAG TPA: hypothetical protein VJI15_06205 [Candidatus Nanoarchaeia archaeon]|nr:hypothetical protein [Candidatus Nanoarchaeia archaeon]